MYISTLLVLVLVLVLALLVLVLVLVLVFICPLSKSPRSSNLQTDTEHASC